MTKIRVAQGRYTPDQGWGRVPGDREAAFELVNDLAIRGGYGGLTAANPDERDLATYETVLSGDLGNDDGLNSANKPDNCHHVVTA